MLIVQSLFDNTRVGIVPVAGPAFFPAAMLFTSSPPKMEPLLNSVRVRSKSRSSYLFRRTSEVDETSGWEGKKVNSSGRYQRSGLFELSGSSVDLHRLESASMTAKKTTTKAAAAKKTTSKASPKAPTSCLIFRIHSWSVFLIRAQKDFSAPPSM